MKRLFAFHRQTRQPSRVVHEVDFIGGKIEEEFHLYIPELKLRANGSTVDGVMDRLESECSKMINDSSVLQFDEDFLSVIQGCLEAISASESR